MSRLPFYILSIGILLLTPIGMSDTLQIIRFSNDMWDVEIVPQSLAVNVHPAGTDITVRAALGQTGLGPVTDFTHEENGVSWKLLELALTVHVKSLQDSLTLEFIQDAPANDPNNFTWPHH